MSKSYSNRQSTKQFTSNESEFEELLFLIHKDTLATSPSKINKDILYLNYEKKDIDFLIKKLNKLPIKDIESYIYKECYFIFNLISKKQQSKISDTTKNLMFYNSPDMFSTIEDQTVDMCLDYLELFNEHTLQFHKRLYENIRIVSSESNKDCLNKLKEKKAILEALK